MIKKHIYVLWASLLISFCINAQDTLEYNIPRVYGFEDLPGDTITNWKHLSKFLSKLVEQKKKNSQKINILHIGDSHLQADYITHTTRITLQKIYGNSGRGFISPLKISKSNEPFNYQTTSNLPWKSARCVSIKKALPIGLGGMAIKTNNPNAFIYMKTYNTDSMDYSFNKISLIVSKSDSSFQASLTDSTTQNLITNIPSNSSNILQYTSKFNTSFLKINLEKSDSTKTNFIFYGAILENGKNGIVYNCVGINGAKYKDFSNASDFCNQTSILHPDLLIISLGTNESFQKKYNSENFYKEIDTLIQNLKKTNPNTPFILTTPANSFYYHHINYNLPLVSQTIVNYAKDNNLACWDLFSITGGEKSAIEWKKSNLLSRDGIHYTKDGYIHQGNLLTKAIINAYNTYVSNR